MPIAKRAVLATALSVFCSATPAASDDTPAAQPPYGPLATVGMVRLGNRSYVDPVLKWRTRGIGVCWDDPADAHVREKGWVRDAVTASWQAHANIAFVGWGSCAEDSGGIRITISDVGAYTTGLGTQIDGAKGGMVLNFTFRNWNVPHCGKEEAREDCIRIIAVHEFGHALGFAHEQNRPDTKGECNLPASGSKGTVYDLTPWDKHSVMNYCNPAYLNHGVLSQGDVATVRWLYPGAA